MQNLILRDPVIFAVTAGFILDLIFGDPHSMIHPVQIIGRIISFCENLYRKIFGKKERTAGVFCALTVLFISTAVPCLLLWLCGRISFYLELALQIWWCGRLLAARSLRDETMKVYRAVRSGDLEKSRKAVSMIVGRDTERLDLTGVTKAAVETAAENTSDGEAAPLFYMMLFGAAGGFFYKAVNTMDSMVGYQNERYLYFGRGAARLDDAANYLPARLAALLLIAAAALTGENPREAGRIWRRDRRKHASPNSAQCEAAVAGALGLRLCGPAVYFGTRYDKPYIGDDTRPIEPEDIRRACRMEYAGAFLGLLLFGLGRMALAAWIGG